MSLVSFLCLLLLSLAVIPDGSVAQSGVANLLISRVSGCVDVGSATTNCPLQPTLTIYLDSSTPAPLTSNTITTYITAPSYVSINTYSRVSASDPSRLTLTSTFVPNGYSSGWTGAGNFLNVSFYDYDSASYSTPFAGVSFAYVPPPTLTSMTGCAKSDGVGTYNCAPDVDVLTLIGSGLTWLSLGRNTGALLADIRSGWRVSVRLVNDSCLLFPLNETYSQLVLPVHYNGTVLQLGFLSYVYVAAPDDMDYFDYYNTNTLPVSFIPLPPPRITRISVTNCNNSVTINLAAYYDCIPGVSSLLLIGSYMYELTVLLAGEPCIAVQALPGSYSCGLPMIASYTPGYNYPLSVYNSAGNITQEATFSFTSLPTISSVVPCADYGVTALAASPRCQAGSQLTVLGSRFPIDPTVQVLLSTGYGVGSSSAVNVSCLSASVLDSGTVVCTLPSLNSSLVNAFAGALSSIRVLFNSSTWGTNTINRVTYNYINAPSISSVTPAADSGCTVISATSLSTCGSSPVITISGQYFTGDSPTSIYANSPISNNAYYYLESCTLQDTYTDTTFVCTMPPTSVVSNNDAVVSGFVYLFQMRVRRNGTTIQSNAFRVTFAPLPVLPDTASSSTGMAPSPHSSKLSTGATAGIVVAAVIVLVVAVAALLLLVRHRRNSASDSPKSDDGTRRLQMSSLDSSASSEFGGVEVEMNVSPNNRAGSAEFE